MLTVPAFLIGCHSGTNSNSGSSTQPYVQPEEVTPSETSNLQFIDNGTTKVEPGVIQHNRKENSVLLNQTSGFNGAIDGGNSIGWISSLQKYAPDNCWNYSVAVKDTQHSSSSSYAQNATAIQDTFGMSTSITAKLTATDSLTANLNMSSLFASQDEAVNVGSKDAYLATFTFNVQGLNSYGEALLQNAPGEFINRCGDKVLNQIPVAVTASYLLTYRFESEATNKSLSAGISASTTFADATANINTTASRASSKVSVTANTFTTGVIDPTAMATAQTNLSYCTSTTPEARQQCLAGLGGLENAVEAGFIGSLNQLTGDSNTEPNYNNWQAKFAVDYTRPTLFEYVGTSDQLNNIGKPTAIGNSEIDKYMNAIKHNTAVLHDLSVAKAALDTIGAGIELLPSNVAPMLTPYPDNHSLALEYTGSLNASYDNLEELITQCVGSSISSAIDLNCSRLDPNSSVISIFNANYTDRVHSNVKSTIEKTIKALIYTDQVTNDMVSSSPYYKSTIAPKIATVNSYIVYLPAKTIDGKKDYVLVTVPVNLGQQTAQVRTGEENVPIFVGAFQAAIPSPANDFWGSWDLTSQDNSGSVGYYAGSNQLLFARLDSANPFAISSPTLSSIVNSMTTAGVGLQQCIPFASGSSGCTYTVTTHMSPAILNLNAHQNGAAGKVIQKIKDSYNPNLTPTATKLFGSNKYVTLYPYYTFN